MAKAYNVSVRLPGLTPKYFSVQCSSPALAARRAVDRFDLAMKQAKQRGSVAAMTSREALRKGQGIVIDILGTVDVPDRPIGEDVEDLVGAPA